MPNVQELSDNESGYRLWSIQNAEGFVVNQRWGTYLRLHHVSCRFEDLPGTRHTNPVARSTKICSDGNASHALNESFLSVVPSLLSHASSGLESPHFPKL